MKKLLISVLFVLMIPLFVNAADVTMAWDANRETNLAGYKIHYGYSSGIYEITLDIPLANLSDPQNPWLVVTGLDENTNYYFVCTAYNENGLSSGHSNEVSIVISGGGIVHENPPAAPAALRRVP